MNEFKFHPTLGIKVSSDGYVEIPFGGKRQRKDIGPLKWVTGYPSPDGLPFNKVRKAKTPQKERVAACRDGIVAELNATGKIRATARKFGVDYNSVRNIYLELKNAG